MSRTSGVRSGSEASRKPRASSEAKKRAHGLVILTQCRRVLKTIFSAGVRYRSSSAGIPGWERGSLAMRDVLLVDQVIEEGEDRIHGRDDDGPDGLHGVSGLARV